MKHSVYAWLGIRVDRGGGVSGGAPTEAILWALRDAGHTAAEAARRTLQTTMYTDYGSKVDRHVSLTELWSARRNWKEDQELPPKGLISAMPLGNFVQSFCTNEWPSRFWTQSLTKESRIIFTAKGVYEVTGCGCIKQISDQPAPIAIAIASSASIPGHIRRHLLGGRQT
jgi:predicted acylesterase/phospholipase RssA